MLVLDSGAEAFQGAVASCTALPSCCHLFSPQTQRGQSLNHRNGIPVVAKNAPEGNHRRSLPLTVTVSTKLHTVWQSCLARRCVVTMLHFPGTFLGQHSPEQCHGAVSLTLVLNRSSCLVEVTTWEKLAREERPASAQSLYCWEEQALLCNKSQSDSCSLVGSTA